MATVAALTKLNIDLNRSTDSLKPGVTAVPGPSSPQAPAGLSNGEAYTGTRLCSLSTRVSGRWGVCASSARISSKKSAEAPRTRPLARVEGSA